MIYLHRLLLLNSAEKQPPLRGRSNASWLPHLLWGNIIQISYFISTEYYQFVELLKLTQVYQIWWLQYLFESVNDVTVLLCGHTIHKSCLKEMREHFQWVSRSSLDHFYLLKVLLQYMWWFLSMILHQVCMPSLLKVSLWYVKGLGEIWLGDCCYTNSRTVSKQNGQHPLFFLSIWWCWIL